MTDKRKVKRARRAQNDTVLKKKRAKYQFKHYYCRFMPRAAMLDAVSLVNLSQYQVAKRRYQMALLAMMHAEMDAYIKELKERFGEAE